LYINAPKKKAPVFKPAKKGMKVKESAPVPTGPTAAKSKKSIADRFLSQVAQDKAKKEEAALHKKKVAEAERNKHAQTIREGMHTLAKNYAYRGVTNHPEDDLKRGGLLPWQIGSVAAAETALYYMANSLTGFGSLKQVADSWQKGKNKKEGYFLSCGLSEKDAYDTYDYVYRINITGLTHSPWGVWRILPVRPHAVESCWLYVRDWPPATNQTMIAIRCLLGGVERHYELLIMTPCKPEILEVRSSKETKFTKLEEWVKKNPKPGPKK